MTTYGNQNAQPRVITASSSVAGVVDLAVLTAAGAGVSVTNNNGTAPIWFTVSEPGGACPLPTGGGANCYCVGSVAGATVQVRHDGQFGSIVQLVSSGTPNYTVAVLGNRANM